MQQSTADDDAKAEDSKVTRNFILELAPQPDNSNSSSSTKIEVREYVLLCAMLAYLSLAAVARKQRRATGSYM
jgi:hypothetical protein